MSEAEIRRTIRGFEKASERVIKRLAFAVNNAEILATPVDTGWARANWIVSIGRPTTAPQGSRGAVSTGAQSAGQARLLVYTLVQGDIWLVNAVPYIQALNAGHSPQAPAGFIQAAILAGIRSVIR